jgi:hypothetical protein
MMGFIKKWTAGPEELTPDPVTGSLPTGKPTPKVASQGVAVVVLTALAPVITGILAKRNIRMDPGQFMALVTGLAGGVGAIVTGIGYFKKNGKPAGAVPSDASSLT